MEKGQLSIHAENLLPIIKKWLYSDKDIFVRELISNGCDAIAKRRAMGLLGEESPRIVVDLSKEARTLSFTDNGVGMTAEEVKKYINQVAFSGASDFLERFKDNHEQLIGHFGLGFYSAFMAGERVRIETLSCLEGSQAVAWESDGGMEYEMESIDRQAVGTTITLFLNDDSEEFLDAGQLRQTIQKYCSFMPVPIYLTVDGKPQEQHVHEEGEGCEHEHEPVALNNPSPLYLKAPKDVTEEEYKEFYRSTFLQFDEPLFWIHLNVDYPFNLKGILYFPRLQSQFGQNEGQVKLYAGQVFVADNIKEVIPEFLLLLRGVIDCPDLPLNVSRSFLQNDGYVRKLSDYITRKVADKLLSLFKNEREAYDKYWDDIHPFIKYGCLRDHKFYDRVKDCLIYKTTLGESFTLPELLERAKESHENKLFYTQDKERQSAALKLYEGMDVLVMNTPIDNPFMQMIEGENKDLRFARVDAELADALKGGEAGLDEEACKKLTELFTWALDDKSLKLETQALKDEATPALLMQDENMRRYQEAMRLWSQGGETASFPVPQTLVLNTTNPLIGRLATMEQDENSRSLCLELKDLAELSLQPLSPERMNEFLQRTLALLNHLG